MGVWKARGARGRKRREAAGGTGRVSNGEERNDLKAKVERSARQGRKAKQKNVKKFFFKENFFNKKLKLLLHKRHESRRKRTERSVK